MAVIYATNLAAPAAGNGQPAQSPRSTAINVTRWPLPGGRPFSWTPNIAGADPPPCLREITQALAQVLDAKE